MVDADWPTAGVRRKVAYGNLVKGLLEYRQGHFAEAKDRLQKVVASPDALDDWNRSVQAEMLLAMALYQLNEMDAARTRLASGLQMADKRSIKAGKKISGQLASTLLLAQKLMHEATTLIPEAKPGNNSLTVGSPNPELRVAEPRRTGNDERLMLRKYVTAGRGASSKLAMRLINPFALRLRPSFCLPCCRRLLLRRWSLLPVKVSPRFPRRR